MSRKKLPNPKGHNYLRPCATCQAPCFGLRCRPCAERAKADLRTIATKRTGSRNPDWGSGANGKFTAITRKDLHPTSSWWLGKTREEFKAAHAGQLNRIQSVPSPYLPAAVNE